MNTVYSFQDAPGDKYIVGGKGANLAEMCRIGLPVPPGFIINAKTCNEYQKRGELWPEFLANVHAAMEKLEVETGLKFGSGKEPLLVSVRSGAAISMPGMMDTVLNLGLNDDTVVSLAKKTGNERFAYDCYRRFLTMFADVVLGLKHAKFDEELDHLRAKEGVKTDAEISAAGLKKLTSKYKDFIRQDYGSPFPQNPYTQLELSIRAVFDSWKNPRAKTYRRLNRIPDSIGTAVCVQLMVFGNMGQDCATGVAFTRNPSTGHDEFYGEFLQNAQGEDVVAGIRTPLPIEQMEAILPEAFAELVKVSKTLEDHFGDMQDLEFTVMNSKLYMLQTRTGKRTGLAAVRIALDMLESGRISETDAILRVAPAQLEQLLRPIFDPVQVEAAKAKGALLARGLNAGPGAASGKVVFDADTAVAWQEKGEKVILVRDETSPEDIHGMHASEGFLTARGGMTSHAALVARQMGKVCVAGCSSLHIQEADHTFTVGNHEVKQGDWISLDGFTGEVLLGKLQAKPSEVVQVLVDKTLSAKKSEVYQMYEKLLTLADKYRKLRVRANADQGDQSTAAIALGAEGIGLCRTEHMFFGPGKIEHMRAMILSSSKAEREAALAKLLPIQRKDFEEIFVAMGDRPVTIRLLDPPLHEFLPHHTKEREELAKHMGLDEETVHARIDALRESNPMLGHRGCRLGITYPEITAMQAEAIIEAAVNVSKKGVAVKPEIMIPIVSHRSEFDHQEKIVRAAAERAFKRTKHRVEYLVGTMIELPRAALTADEIAVKAEFFSFGTNDLTQTTLGVSRDDAGGFLSYYQTERLIEADPFQTIDRAGVGQLVRIGTERGRATRPELKVGICGEHGGDPASVEFCHEVGLDYVSCSPYRIPIARMAAAHAALKEL